MRVLIQGAGLGGCAAAAIMAKSGVFTEVHVIEKRKSLATDGAGICLYSNALLSLDKIGQDLRAEVISNGFSCPGDTVFLTHETCYLGSVKYKSVAPHLPPYIGIDRSRFLSILHKYAASAGAVFRFGVNAVLVSNDASGAVVEIDGVQEHYDLVVAADGMRSSLRTAIFPDVKPQYSGFSLWHSMHKKRAIINDKMTITMPDRRFGIIPLSSEEMYIWASMKTDDIEPIAPENRAEVFKKQFSGCNGFIGDLINEVGADTFIHQTFVQEVKMDGPWHKDRVVLIGDAAHASTPFMAQGGAMAIHDAVSLTVALTQGYVSSRWVTMDSMLEQYTAVRRPLVQKVQSMSANIGLTYQSPIANIPAAQAGLDAFYSNPDLIKYI